MQTTDMDNSEGPVNEIEIENAVVHDTKRLQEIEMDLAKTKLELCEANCQLQDLNHQISILTEANTSNSNPIIQKYKKFTGLH